MSECKHPKGFRFLPCSAADRLPGMWICDACGFTSDHNPWTGMKYLDHPDPNRNWKGKITLNIPGGKGKSND